ncbi:MAG: class I SAM-dependent methyltransferase [Candidatus Anammoxibacter sp.]
MNSCISCKSSLIRLVGGIPAASNFAGYTSDAPIKGGNLYECKNCYLLFRYPRLSQDDRDDLYTQADEDKWSSYEEEREDWKIAANWVCKLPQNSTVLDIGCFDGQFLENLGTDYNKFGVEIHHKARQLAVEKGIKIVADNFYDLQTLPDKFNAVIAMDVIEHVEDPLTFLTNLTGNVCSGGRIIISTGNTDACSWKLMKNRYYYCTIGEHISFINPRWLHKAANDLGLNIVKTVRFSHFRFGVLRRINDLSKNLLYKVAPNIAGRLRQENFDKKDYRAHPELADSPPWWESAKDHLICLLEKP